ncbi:hypothetical protein TCAL_15757 [Tigriopus californicus]|uniref:Uncharacterized protein n=1 Tax=Tigriopus californicus TaxID=6832 RepID=A0A553P8C4_TIGCA|nr:hypothetical protein TCAL_15757 [Tigriopus californicus]
MLKLLTFTRRKETLPENPSRLPNHGKFHFCETLLRG